MLGGVTRPMLPHLPGVPHLHVNRLLDWPKKKTTLHVHHPFLYISQPLLNDCDMKLSNFTRPVYGVGEHNTKNFLFLLLNLDTVLLDLTQKISPTFDKLNEIK